MKILKVFNSKQIRTAAIGSLSVKFLSAVFALLNGILLARLLSVEGFGIYVLAFTTITVLSIPVSLGLPQLITRYISKYDVTKDDSSIKGLLIRSNQLVVLTSFVAIFIALLSYFIWWDQYSEELVKTIWYAFILLPLLVLGSIRAAALRGLKYVILGQLPDTFLRNLFLSLFLIMVVLFDFDLVPYTAMILHAIAAGLAFIIGLVFLRNKLLKRLRGIKPTFKNRFWFNEAIPFSITSGVQVIKTRSLIYILAAFGSLEAVAIFDVAMRGANLVSFTLDALNTAISPYLSSAYENEQKDTFQRIVKKATRIIFGFSFPVALVFILFGRSILGILFGEEYVVAYYPLVILCVGQLVNSLTGSTSVVLNMTGNQKYLSNNQLTMMIITLLISIPLVLYLNVVGAAIAVGFVIILQNVILVQYIFRKLKINTTVY